MKDDLEDLEVMTKILYEDIRDLNKEYGKNSKTKEETCYFLGIIGELFLECVVILTMKDLRVLNTDDEKNSYELIYQPENTRVDYQLIIRDICGFEHIIPMDAKNWGVYSIGRETLEEKITSKFDEYKKNQAKFITMTKGNRGKYYGVGCNKKGITTLEVEGQIDENTTRWMLQKYLEKTTNQLKKNVEPIIRDCKGIKMLEKIKAEIRNGSYNWYIQ